MPSAEIQLTHEIARAGAGAGKTTLLVSRVVEAWQTIFSRDGRDPKMVVTTFTRKATQELRDRLIARALEIGSDPGLIGFVSSSVNLHISTIHGVLSLFLRRYGQFAGLDPQFTIASTAESRQLRRRVLRDLLADPLLAEGVLEFESFSDLLLLLEELGSQRKTFLTLRPIEPTDLKVALDSQTARMATRWLNLCEGILEATTDKKFIDFVKHSRLVIEALRELDQNSLSWQKLADLQERLPRTVNRGNPPPLPMELNEELSGAKKELKKFLDREELRPEYWSRFVERAKLVELISKRFEDELWRVKQGAGILEMADLELVSWQIIESFPVLAEAFRAEWDYWLIDEFQDTSPIQSKLLEQLSGSKPKFIVGDPQQSIYLFRGARSEVFHRAEKEGLERGSRFTDLQVNYRSEPALLEFFNDFFKSIGAQFSRMIPRSVVDLKSQGSGALPQAIFHQLQSEDREHEMAVISAHLKEVIATGSSPSDVFILGRTNDQLAEIARYLKGLGWPTHLHVSSGFQERREVLDTLGLLRFLVNPHDDTNFVMILRSPWFRVRDGEISELASQRRMPMSLWQTALTSKEWMDQFVFMELQRLHQRCEVVGFSESLLEGLRRFGVLDFASHYDSTGRREANIWKVIHELKSQERSSGFQVLDFCSVAASRRSDGEGLNEGDASAVLEPNCINLMTVHAAKGLKCKHLILPFAGESARLTDRSRRLAVDESTLTFSVKIPVLREEGDESASNWLGSVHADEVVEGWRRAEVEEHARVLYVALTRAQQSVHISWAGLPERHSWASMWKWDFKSSTDKYSVAFREGLRQSESFSAVKDKGSMVPAPWSQLGAPGDNLGVAERISVSDLIAQPESLRTSKPEQLLRKAQRTSLGLRLHRVFETLSHHPDMDLEVLCAGQTDQEIIEIVRWVRSLTDPPMEHLLRNGFGEWGFQFRDSEPDGGSSRTIEGQIDLWGMDPQDLRVAWVVDYKTGSPDFEEQSFDQLRIYARALKLGHKASTVKMAVIYPRQQKLICRDFEG